MIQSLTPQTLSHEISPTKHTQNQHSQSPDSPMDSVWGLGTYANGISINHRDLPLFDLGWEIIRLFCCQHHWLLCFRNLYAPGVGSRKGSCSIFILQNKFRFILRA